ncbi:MAG: hypothetical protein QF535_19265, partial [Anaerolineales bacterium]|nr:hypothetical protein [Anaerolineales bacterium]
MANKILIKSKVDQSGAPDVDEATVAEMAVNTYDGKLYVGTNIDVDGTTNGTYLAGEDSAQVSWVGAPIDTDTALGTSDGKLATQGAIKSYVDATAQGLYIHDAVVVATTAELDATYDNGTAGVGATLTNAGTQEAIAIDGITLTANERVLVKDQSTGSTQFENGIYQASTLGNGSTNWVLTRVTDFDAAADVKSGAFVFVQEGSTNADSGFVQTDDTASRTMGSTAIAFSQFSGAGQITAGTNLTKLGNQLNVDDAFLINSGSDTMSGTLTATGLITGNSGTVKFMDGNGSNYTTIAAHATTTADVNYTLPAADGTDGQFLKTDGSGVMSWSTAAASDVDVSNANLLTRLAALESSSGATDETITIGTDAGDTLGITGKMTVA